VTEHAYVLVLHKNIHVGNMMMDVLWFFCDVLCCTLSLWLLLRWHSWKCFVPFMIAITDVICSVNISQLVSRLKFVISL